MTYGAKWLNAFEKGRKAQRMNERCAFDLRLHRKKKPKPALPAGKPI